MPIIGITASGMSSANFTSWMAYFTTTIGARGVATFGSSVYVTGDNGTQMINAKYNSNGSVNWQRGLDNSTSTTSDIPRGAAVDSSGNLYGCGYRTIYKYNSSGSIQWQKNVTSATTTTIWRSIEVDSSGNIYVIRAGDLGPSGSFVLYKISSTPAITWQKSITAVYGWYLSDSAVSVDSSGNVYVVATENNGMGIGYAVLMKFNSSGTIQWSRKINDVVGIGAAHSVIVDSADNVYVSWSFNPNAYITKFNSSGTEQWTRSINLGDTTGLVGVSIDSSNNIYFTGQFTSTNIRTFIVKYNSSGTIQWQRSIRATLTAGGSNRNLSSTACSVDSTNGQIALSGILDTEFFAARLPIDGSKTGTYTLGLYTIFYAASSQTEASASVSISSRTYTPGTPTLSLVDQTATDSASTLTNNSVTL
jgi:hypothetical protein